ncbi:MAG TPA: protein translocase subunit SecD [Vicinamibacterales bacterium]|nr:protein translocase subunit SecD [Vicinamibacterales bacterium]
MMKNLRWKIATIVAVTALGIWAIYPPQEKIRLGLDLKGGVHLVLRVNTEEALRAECETAMERLRSELARAGVANVTATLIGVDGFELSGVPPEQAALVRQLSAELENTFNRSSGAGGTHRFTMKPNVRYQVADETVRQAIRTIENRVNELGVTEPIVARHGGVDQILVQLPGVEDVARAKEIMGSPALLELKLVEAGPAASREELLAPHGGKEPPGQQVVSGVGDGTSGVSYYLVQRTPVITGRDLRNARPTLDEYNQPAVSFSLKPDGAARFSNVTGQNVGRALAIILDGRVVSAPRIESRISDEGRITGSFTQQEAQDLVLTLRSGALPASLTYLEERTVGPSLGADSIRAGVTASLMGLAFVTIFILIFYKLSGVNAIVAMALNLLILLALMAYFDATMTLPGIAGVILTIGMGVDSNVLIFERIKEELAAQKGVRAAVANGFDRVFLTILDTHVASLIAAAFLFQFGTGPIRGFATTLTIGLLANVFTSVFVSRALFELVLAKRQTNRLSI